MKIVYKTVAAILALIVIPLAIFGPIMYYKVQSTAMQALLFLAEKYEIQPFADFLEENGEIPDTLVDSFSLYTAFDIAEIAKTFSEGASNISGNNADEKTDDVVSIIKTPALVTAAVFILIMICSIVTAILAIVCKNNKKALISSLVGVALSIAFTFAFKSFASLFVDGTVSLSSFISNSFAARLIANVEVLSLSTTYWLIPICFAGVAVWTLFYNITSPKNEITKKEKKKHTKEA